MFGCVGVGGGGSDGDVVCIGGDFDIGVCGDGDVCKVDVEECG